MKISGNNEIAKYVNEATTDRTQETVNNASKSIDATSKVERGTVVNLSQKSRDVQWRRPFLRKWLNSYCKPFIVLLAF